MIGDIMIFVCHKHFPNFLCMWYLLRNSTNSTHQGLERSRQAVADFVDGGVDGGFRLVVLQVGVHRLHDQLTQGARRARKIFLLFRTKT
jgi:hypothetical protein